MSASCVNPQENYGESLLNMMADRIDPVLRSRFILAGRRRLAQLAENHKEALWGAGIGMACGQILDWTPIIGDLTMGMGSLAGMALGGYAGHRIDQERKSQIHQELKAAWHEVHDDTQSEKGP